MGKWYLKRNSFIIYLANINTKLKGKIKLEMKEF